MVLYWHACTPSKICWPPLLKIYISEMNHYWFILVCCMAMSCQAFLPGFFVKFVIQLIYAKFAFILLKKVSLKSSTQKPDMRLSKLCVTPTLHPKWLPLLKVGISLNGKNRINWNLKFYVCSDFFSMKFKSNWKLHVGDGLQALLVFCFCFWNIHWLVVLILYISVISTVYL